MQIENHPSKNISKNTLLKHLNLTSEYKKKIKKAVNSNDYLLDEASLFSPFDKKTITDAVKFGESVRKNIKLVLLVGIGGSNMGTCAVYDALYNDTTPKLISFDTIETEKLRDMEKIIQNYNSQEILLIVISKSGNTTETIMNANILFDLFAKKFGEKEVAKQTLIITNKNSLLYEKGERSGIKTFSIPEKVGGRYSVFTNVGLIPMTMLGFDIEKFTNGACDAITKSINETGASAPEILSSFLFETYSNGARIHDFFIWNKKLKTLGKWYRQLLAESIGKKTSEGISVGISPVISIGSTDLHSVGQLVFGGENNRFTTLISSTHSYAPIKYIDKEPFTLDMLKEKTTTEVMEAILSGVEKTYKTQQLSYSHIKFDKIDERELGAFMALQMMKTMYLAKLLNVNAFDQPAVEFYKEETRKILKDNK
jgi:glucose-6-phosphate isomerase